MIKTYGIGSTLATLAVVLLTSSVGAAPSDDIGHGFAPVGGTRLFYEIKGTGPAVVLIHGGQLDCRMWDDQFAALSRNFQVIRYDVRGLGGSSRPDLLYSNADDLAGLLDYLKVTKAHIVGLSLGGRIAIDFALAHPTRVSSLVACRAGPVGLRATELGRNRSSDVEHHQGRPRRRAGPGHRAVAERSLHGPGHGAGPARAPTSKNRPRERPLLAGESRAAAPSARSPPNRLGEIKVPTLLILGDRDVPQIKATIEQLEKGISHAKKVVIKNAGHMVNMEQPESFNEAVLDFLRKQPHVNRSRVVFSSSRQAACGCTPASCGGLGPLGAPGPRLPVAAG